MKYSQDDLIKALGELIIIATMGQTIQYAELAQLVGLTWNHRNRNDRKTIGQFLGRISCQEYAQGRPLLTAIVVRKKDREPGGGFFGLEGFPKSKIFWKTEKKRVHDFWMWRQ
jgi:hypothetical protein